MPRNRFDLLTLNCNLNCNRSEWYRNYSMFQFEILFDFLSFNVLTPFTISHRNHREQTFSRESKIDQKWWILSSLTNLMTRMIFQNSCQPREGEVLPYLLPMIQVQLSYAFLCKFRLKFGVCKFGIGFFCERAEFHKDFIEIKGQLKSSAGNLGRNSSNIISELTIRPQSLTSFIQRILSD